MAIKPQTRHQHDPILSNNARPKIIPVRINPHHRPGRQPGLAAQIEAFFVRHRNRLIWVHATMFLFFLAVIVLPLFISEAPEDATPLSHFTVFANYAMWGLWFPLVLLSVIFTGRSWCGLLCPMGAASEWLNKTGLQRPIPAWMQWEGTPIVSFLIITILGQTVGVRDHPEAVAEVFGGTMLLAIIIGYIYGRNKRAWCRHMCPIGLLLGIFSRIGAVQFAARRPRPGGDRYTEKTVCPNLIDIPRKEESRHCIECFRCVHPESKGGLQLRLRHPGEEIENIREHNPNPFEVWFLFLGIGVALGGFLWLVLPQYGQLRQMVGEWFINNGHYWIGESGPWWLMSVHPERREVFNWLDFSTIIGFMLGIMLLLSALLALTTGLSAWLSGQLNGDKSLVQRFTELGYQYAPVAMVSLVIGLGSALFQPLENLQQTLPSLAKGILFTMGLLWSLWLGNQILMRQGVASGHRWIPLLPGALGSLAVGAAWWPGIFGI